MTWQIGFGSYIHSVKIDGVREVSLLAQSGSALSFSQFSSQVEGEIGGWILGMEFFF